MVEKKTATPSHRLYEKLLNIIKPSNLDVCRLRNRTVLLPDDGLMGPVVDITGTEFLYQPQVRVLPNGRLEWLEEREEVYVDPFSLEFPKSEGPVIARISPPKMIGFGKDDPAQNLNFSPIDPYLDTVLEKGLKQTPKIENVGDLREITKWVHDEIPYNTKGGYTKREGRFSLGEVISRRGAVCRHIAAVELALLKLQEIPGVKPLTFELYNPSAQLESMRKGESLPENRFHMALQVVTDDIDGWPGIFITDPTNNLVLAEDDYRRELMSRASMTFTLKEGHGFQGKW
jgi:hypothetical protein